MRDLIQLHLMAWHLIYEIADTGKRFTSMRSRKRFYLKYLKVENPAYCKNIGKLEKCIEKLEEIKKELKNE